MTALNSEGLEKAYKAAEQIDGEWVSLQPNIIDVVIHAYLSALPPVDGLEVVGHLTEEGGATKIGFHPISSRSEGLVTLSQASSVIAGLKAEIEDLRDEWQAEYDARLAARRERITAERDALGAYRKLKAAEARIAELEAAIDSAEIVGGLTENGNLWRFWSQKAQETAGKAEARISSLEQANEALMRDRTSLIETKREQIERLTAERDEAQDAENQAKDCFWAIYPEYLSLGGAPVSTEAARTKLAARISSLEEENKRLREALTPSGDTKAAYAGEFFERVEIVNPMFEGYEDDEPETIMQRFPVSWTTIKEIMAAIRAYAQTEDHNG